MYPPAELRYGLGLSVAGAERHTRLLERFFTILPDSAATYQSWRVLVVEHQVSGRKVHDVYLVAAMIAHGVTQIMTFDTGDFARYGAIQATDPGHPTIAG